MPVPCAKYQEWSREAELTAKKQFPLDIKSRVGEFSFYAGTALFYGTWLVLAFVFWKDDLLSQPFTVWAAAVSWKMVVASLVGAFLLMSVGGRLSGQRRESVAVRARDLLFASLKAYEVDVVKEEHFYFSEEWLRLRAQIIRRDGVICKMCGKSTLPGMDLVVDHIKPRSVFPELALDPSNLQILCLSCNSRKGNRRVEEV